MTGEHREYLPELGKFGPTHVRSPFFCRKGKPTCGGGTGAWELTARFAYLGFADGYIPPSDGLKVGDRLAHGTFGVNWYLNDYDRFMFNYIHAVPVDPNFGPSGANGFFVRSGIYW